MGETSDELIRATEKVIRRGGIDELNLRQVTGLAGANLAAVNYHFGGKAGLLYAVLERRLTPIHTERLRRLTRLLDRAGGAPPAVKDIVEALIDPLFDALAELGDLAATMMELALRLLTHPPERPRRPHGEVTLMSTLRRFDDALGRALPRLDPGERWRRLIFVTSLLFQVFMLEPFMRELDEGFALQHDLGAVRESMKRFAVAGLLAPAPRARTRPVARRRRS
jgi:AcrR family transcriptional regulator